MPWPQTGATHYYAQLGLPDKGRAIKGLVVCNNWDLEPYELLNGLALGCYQSSPEVWLECVRRKIVRWFGCIIIKYDIITSFNQAGSVESVIYYGVLIWVICAIFINGEDKVITRSFHGAAGQESQNALELELKLAIITKQKCLVIIQDS